MDCKLLKKVKKVNDKTFVNYYVYFENHGVMIPIEVKTLPQPKAENYGKKEDYQKEVEFRDFVNSKFRTQLDTLATLVKDEDK